MKGGITMKETKKISNKILSATADLALEAMIAASGLASAAGTYQPAEPEKLKKIAEKHGKVRKGI